MAYDPEPVIAELKAIAVTTWPEITEVLEAERADQLSLASAGLVPPYAVILFADAGPAPEYDEGESVYRLATHFMYVAKVRGKVTAVRSAITLLQRALWTAPGAPDPLTRGSIEHIGKPSWSSEVQPDEFLRDPNRTLWAGVLPVSVLFGELG